jgi:dihydropteroate synthase
LTSRLPVVALDAPPRGLEADARIYLKPMPDAPTSDGAPLPGARRLAGAGPACRDVEILIRRDDRVETCRLSVDDAEAWGRDLPDPAAERLAHHLELGFGARDPFAGLSLAEAAIMGIVNVTPDSFSDGGDAFEAGDAVARGRALAVAGAAILDIGGESTRPGAEPVADDEEIRRVVPVIEELAGEGRLLSIDSRKAPVMAAALEAGAAIVNDVSALTHDPEALDVAAETEAPVVLMHAQGDPRTMQAAPAYDHVSLDVFDFLEARVEACLACGLKRAGIAVDPGFGFGKTVAHNLTLMRDLPLFHMLGCPLLLGASRKSTIAKLAGPAAPKERLGGSLALALAGERAGVHILRVHDVAQTRQAVEVWRVVEGRSEGL